MLGAVLLGLVGGVIARMLTPNDVFRNMSGATSWLASIASASPGPSWATSIFTVGLGIGDTDVFDLGGIISVSPAPSSSSSSLGFFLRRRGAARL